MSRTVSWTDLVDAKAQAEYERLTLLEEIFDPVSVRNLERVGIRPGWRCLEVGAGAGSIARAMADRAGPGNVVATDLSTDFLAPLREIGVDVRQHDVRADDPPGRFDLIHSRCVLEHLPDRAAVLARMVSWLAPGGWLLVESLATAPALASHPRVRRAMEALEIVLSQSIGTDAAWARTLPLPLEGAGLIDCGSAGHVEPVRGGSPLARWLTATHRMFEQHAAELDAITQAELDEAYAAYETPSYVDYTWIMVGAWGRRAG